MKERAAAAVHAIVGEKAFDSFVAEEALEAVLADAVGPEREGAVQVLRGDETSWARVLDAARSRSLFAARRAVVVRNADALKGEAEGLDDYLDDPTPGVVLVLLAAKPDRRRSAWMRLLKKASVVKADPPKGQALRAYLQQQLRARQLGVGPDGVEEILERVGQDIRRMIGELDKLAAFAAGARRPLSAADVASVMGKGLAQPLYRLADAFMARRGAEVLELTDDSLEEGEASLRILATLHRALRTLLAARALRGARVPGEQMAARLGVPPFKVRDLLAWERRWPEAALGRALEALGRADRRLKSGTDARVALTDAIVSACGTMPATPSRPGR